MAERTTPTTPRSGFARALRRYWWIIVFDAIAAALIIGIYTYRQAPSYLATTEIIVKAQSLPDQTVFGGDSWADARRNIITQAELVTVPGVLKSVEEDLDGLAGVTTESLEEAVTVTTAVDSDIITLDVEWESADGATAIANSVANGVVQFRTKLDTASLTAAEADLSRRVSELEARGAGETPLATSLRETRNQLQTRIALGSRNAQVVRIADEAREIDPPVARNATLGFLFGGFIGLIGIGASQLIDRRVKTSLDVEEAFGSEVLAEIPSTKARRSAEREGRSSVFETMEGAEAEAYQWLAAGLRVSHVGEGSRTILVTSAQQGEGKSTVAASAAVALARLGLAVAVVDCDFRRPRLHQLFQVPLIPGMTELLAGTATSADGVIRHISEGGPDGRGRHQRITLITAGQPPTRPGDFAGSPATADLIARLGKQYDWVIVDSPPWLVAGDGLALSASADGVIVCARTQRSTGKTLDRLRRSLSGAAAPVLGVVLVGGRSQADAYYGIDYAAETDEPARSSLAIGRNDR